MTTFADLVLFRCAELVPTDAPLYDPDAVAEEGALAALAVAGRLSADDLLSPAGQGLVEAADVQRLPSVAYESDDTLAEYGLRGRLVVGLPEDFHTLVRVRLSRWTAALTTLLSAESGIDPYPADPFYGAGHAALSRVGTPAAFLRTHLFAIEDFPDAYPPTDPTTAGGAGRLRSAVALTPAFDPDTGEPDSALELLYVKSRPDVDRLSATIKDAVAWATASRLLGQDAETRGLAADADARAGAVLSTMPVRAAGIAIRRGLLL